MQKNLLLLDDCFLGKQNKAEAYYTRGIHNNCDTIYIAQNYFRLTRENSNFIIRFPQDVIFLNYAFFCPGTMTTHAESINSDLQRGLDRRLRHTQH